MQRSFQQSGLFALGLSILFSSILFAQSKQLPAQRWEYFTAQFCNHNREELNKYGDDGWELVTVFGDQSNGCGNYTFKRLKSANAPKYVDPNERPKPTANTPACQLTLAQAPKFRGIRLGMSVQELLGLFPGSEENPDVKIPLERAKKPDEQPGLATFGFSAKQYQNTKEAKELFADVSGYHFQFFDSHLVSFTVYVPEYRPDVNWQWTISAWEKKLSETFNLPLSKEWGESNRNHQGSSGLQCNGFFVAASASGRSSYFAIQETTSSSIDDKVAQRKEKMMEKIREEFKLKP